MIEDETGRKTKGGLTCFSEMAAHELKCMRLTGEELLKEIIKTNHPPVKKFLVNGVETEFVPYEIFKKLYIFSTALKKKKDHKQIRVEVSKIRGLKKNEISYFW